MNWRLEKNISKYLYNLSLEMCCYFMFTTFSFKSLFAIITGPCPLVTCRIQTVFWTAVLAILSVVRTITLGTLPSDRIT